jgi:pimeloyl-ACP methyl ester carboxylesterase
MAAEFSKGFVEIRKEHSLYVEYKKAAPGRPTFFLLNGLTYTTFEWREYVEELLKADPGAGIVLYDMEGQGRTLNRRSNASADIPLENQVQDLHDLKKALRISGRTAVVGLSYGGAVGLQYATIHPDSFDEIIVMAPFLERLKKQDDWIRNAIAIHRMWVPLDPRSGEELYDAYLQWLVFSTYHLAETVIIENSVREAFSRVVRGDFQLNAVQEAIFRMVKGAKHWNAIHSAAKLPAHRVHVMGGMADEHVRINSRNEFWTAVPEKAKASYLVLERTHHKLPEIEPEFTAKWTLMIMNGRAHLHSGLTFLANPFTGDARSGKIVIPVYKESLCESLL